MVNKVFKLPLICAGALLVNLALLSSAEAVSFYLGNGFNRPQISNSFNYNQGGIGLRATAFNKKGSKKVYRGLLGLGVVGGGTRKLDGRRETLQLEFSRAIRFVSATFSAVGPNDDAEVTLDGSQIFSGDLPRDWGFGRDWGVGTVSFENSPTGTVALFTAPHKNDDYFLKSVEVEHVPEPLTILGSGLALGAGALFERKRSKANKVKAS